MSCRCPARINCLLVAICCELHIATCLSFILIFSQAGVHSNLFSLVAHTVDVFCDDSNSSVRITGCFSVFSRNAFSFPGLSQPSSPLLLFFVTLHTNSYKLHLLTLGVKHGLSLSLSFFLSLSRALNNHRSPPFLFVTTGLLMQSCLKSQLKQEQGQRPSGGN